MCVYFIILDGAKNISIHPRKDTYDDFELVNCTAVGNPTPTVQWLDSENRTRATGYSSSILNITRDMNHRTYICLASNVVGSISDSLNISLSKFCDCFCSITSVEKVFQFKFKSGTILNILWLD